MRSELKPYEEKMKKTISAMQSNFAAIRAGRANPAVLDRIRVDYFGVQASDLGINPQNDGSVLRITFPPLTEERRKDLSKQIHKMGEESKVAIRSIRRDANETFKSMKKKSELTEDDQKDLEKELQKLTDSFIKEIDNLADAKEKEIMEV